MGKRHEGLPEDEFVIRRNKKGPSKLDRKKAAQAKEGGLVPDTVLNVEPESISEPEIRVETPETKSNTELETEKKEAKMEENIVEGGKIPEGGPELKRYEDFKDEISSLQTKNDLLNYLASAEKFKLSYDDDSIAKSVYFPAYAKEVEKVFNSISPIEALSEVPALYEKVAEIMGNKRREDVELIEDKKSSQGKRNPTQRDADIFEMSSKNNGDRRVYASGSVPEDVKEEGGRIKQKKVAEKAEKSKETVKEVLREKEKREELEGFEKDGKKYLERLQAMDWSKYKYDEDQKKDLIRIELETLLEEIIKKESKFFKKGAKKISKDITKKITG